MESNEVLEAFTLLAEACFEEMPNKAEIIAAGIDHETRHIMIEVTARMQAVLLAVQPMSSV